MDGQSDRPIVATGPMRTIEAAVCFDGSSPAQQFLDQLGEADQQKLAALFAWMAEHGVIRNEQKFKMQEDQQRHARRRSRRNSHGSDIR